MYDVCSVLILLLSCLSILPHLSPVGHCPSYRPGPAQSLFPLKASLSLPTCYIIKVKLNWLKSSDAYFHPPCTLHDNIIMIIGGENHWYAKTDGSLGHLHTPSGCRPPLRPGRRLLFGWGRHRSRLYSTCRHSRKMGTRTVRFWRGKRTQEPRVLQTHLPQLGRRTKSDNG